MEQFIQDNILALLHAELIRKDDLEHNANCDIKYCKIYLNNISHMRECTKYECLVEICQLMRVLLGHVTKCKIRTCTTCYEYINRVNELDSVNFPIPEK